MDQNFKIEDEDEESSGEQRGNLMLEKLEKMFKRPETRVDGQKLLGRISPNAQAYAKYLVVTGPADIAETAKGCRLTEEQVELAMTELESALFPPKKN